MEPQINADERGRIEPQPSAGMPIRVYWLWDLVRLRKSTDESSQELGTAANHR
jgi:hypothetical protein